MKFRTVITLTIIVATGFAVQQSSLYLNQKQILEAKAKESAQLSAQIEKLMYKEGLLRQQLAEAEQQHVALRRLLPDRLDEEGLAQQIDALAAKHGIKILATKTAVSSLPDYTEATTSITLEASDLAARRFMRELKSIPQRIHIVPPQKRGKKNIHLSISIYAVDPAEHETNPIPPCSEIPKGLILPPLLERLTPLYEDYRQQCNFTHNHSELLDTQQQLQRLQQENNKLQQIEKKLRQRP